MSIKLTDTQLVVLSAAARREDRCLIMPDKLKGGAARKFAEKLIALGLAREVKAKPGTAIWRRDEEAGRSFALKLTAAGLSAIAVEADADDEIEPSVAATATPPVAAAVADAAESASGLEATRIAAGALSAPRKGTKLARVVGLLIRSHGATLAELIAATDWLPHTARAALTGLRKRGYAVTLDRSDKARGAAYVIAADAPAGSPATIQEATASVLAPGPAAAAPTSAKATSRSERRVRRTERDAARLVETGSAA